MKIPIVISTLLFSVASFGQSTESNSNKSQDTTSLRQFVIGDRIISCSDCHIDFCGNVLNSRGDTLGKNLRPLTERDTPLYFTLENILLTKNIVLTLIDRNKIKSMNVIKCNEGIKVFSDLAKNGIIILELKDTTIKAENLLDYVQRAHPDKTMSMNNILINGLATEDNKIKYPKWDKLNIEYDTKKNLYNIKTE